METFPYHLPADAPSVGYTRGPRFKTEVVESDTGLEQRRQRAPLSRQPLDVTFSPRENIRTLVQTVEAFFEARGGMFEAFVLYDPDATWVHTKVYVGVGNASATIFTLPSKQGSTGHSVHVNDSILLSGWTVSNDGANLRQRITFTAAPAAGAIIRVTFTGQRAFVGRFASDELVIRAESAGLYSVSFPFISLIGEG